MSSDTPGIQTGPVQAWITDATGLPGPFRWSRLHGGHSNLTYRIEAADGAVAVVRRPPLGELQPRAHDMAREYRIISALWPTAVPVAPPFARCDDASVTGATFYVMGFVDGRPAATGAELTAWLREPDKQRCAADSYIDVMAEMHLLDPDEIGLGDLASRHDFVGRQLVSWYRSWTSSAPAAGYDDARAHELHDLLERAKPAPGPVRLVHGDYGLHNCLFDRDGTVAAVVDWEVCTLGDARADLAYALNRWSVEGHVVRGREEITMPATFPSADEVVVRYQERTGAELTGLQYFIVLNHWRSACIIHGVYTRYLRGQKPGDDSVDLEHFRQTIGLRLDAAEAASASLH